MLRGLPFLPLLFFGAFHPFAQGIIRGRVIAAETGHQIAGVSIFISNTSRGTVTDNKGEFVLAIPAGAYTLVISNIGYQTDQESIDTRNLKPFYDITMHIKTDEMSEVTVRAFDKDGWRRWGEFFKEYFIGTSAFSRHCKILNPEAVRIHYNKNRKILSAYSEGPILIENQALGYLLQVNLENFRMDFTSRDISFYIFPLFKEMLGTPKQKTKWAANRETAYYGSCMHFYRALVRRRVKEEGFSMRLLVHPDSTEIRRIKSSLHQADNTALTAYDNVLRRAETEGDLVEHPGEIDPSSIITAGDTSAIILDFNDVVKVTYLRKAPPDEYINDYGLDPGNPESQVMHTMTRKNVDDMSTTLELWRGTPIEIFSNGSWVNSDMLFNGFWIWWQKMATLLPFDYEPSTPMH